MNFEGETRLFHVRGGARVSELEHVQDFLKTLGDVLGISETAVQRFNGPSTYELENLELIQRLWPQMGMASPRLQGPQLGCQSFEL